MSGSSKIPWYKKIVLYELPIRSFYDGNGDGVGDFRGAIKKLDYLKDLGVNCVWLLPYYPSPLKDDGYDISDFYSIHPDLGTIDDFKEFVSKAHSVGIKVIADMVFNHVSSQHPWFKEARSSANSPKRSWFVWSKSPSKYGKARIIFLDKEVSNWTYDKKARAFFWHRFFYHQPDLNYHNPEVREEMKNVIRYWLNLGLDGFRCDAVPYLFEKSGTKCENLARTHQYFKEVRRMIEDEFPGKILLAEANQWPKEAMPYFGDDNEFHLAFNFPLMPRLFLSLAQKNSRPVVEMIKRTLSIPANCQWANFLRNHDELTLEMVTEKERQFMWQRYASQPRMKLNLGIRRRLAPLLDQDYRAIKLLYSLLFALPGSPVIYYGDEIGMGDNVLLGDRNGVRTPMQWSDEENGGFSTAAKNKLIFPVISNKKYGYLAINVERMEKDADSLLNWLKPLIRHRIESKVLAEGEFSLIENSNPGVLVFSRALENEKIVCLFNFSDKAQKLSIGGKMVAKLFSSGNSSEMKELDEIVMGPLSSVWYRLESETHEKRLKENRDI